MKKIFLIALLAISALSMNAQLIEGTPYQLPKNELRFRVLVEKTTFTPGEFAIYSERFLKKQVSSKASETYRIVGISMYETAVPDSSKSYFVPVDKKHTVFNVECSPEGILLAINAKGKKAPEAPAKFVAAPKASPLNPHDFMNGDILAAGSTAKMAALTAQEIYDIRDSRNELSRGEADYMPKDGEQLKIMLANLDRQEQILLQTFQGVEVTDTVETEIVYTPNPAKGFAKQPLFRFSKKLGLVDADDLAGSPYYISVEDLHIQPDVQTDVEGMKPVKDDPGFTVQIPGKVKVSIYDGNNLVKDYELYVAQYGREVKLSSNLFGKKYTTQLQLNPVTGNVETMELQPLD